MVSAFETVHANFKNQQCHEFSGFRPGMKFSGNTTATWGLTLSPLC
jgi:hypothetical protein